MPGINVRRDISSREGTFSQCRERQGNGVERVIRRECTFVKANERKRGMGEVQEGGKG